MLFLFSLSFFLFYPSRRRGTPLRSRCLRGVPPSHVPAYVAGFPDYVASHPTRFTFSTISTAYVASPSITCPLMWHPGTSRARLHGIATPHSCALFCSQKNFDFTSSVYFSTRLLYTTSCLSVLWLQPCVRSLAPVFFSNISLFRVCVCVCVCLEGRKERERERM